ncbi:MAG: DNA polymerase III subunit gamma/tau [Acidobacteriia bacterium]|nr:DNA polymerase III subunit gamma/tau [Terriglobia bacterium]
MYQVIARKYRPQRFSDVVNQEHVKTTLENAIAQKRIAHGYIFSGQRGTGKTTVARILARCLNCVEGPTAAPCGVCASCREITAGGTVDVIEIDAASNRGINEMRELRENVRYQPARDHYKVFIIDEAHQITTEAFNALLKTIEEPPPWVVFVLCTTEAHKIPATIASRCQHFSFRSVDFADLTARMAWICSEEGVEADEEALAVLAQAGEGSVRDSLSALDQAIACCGNKLNAAEVRSLLGAFSLESLDQVSQALTESSAARMLEIVADLERNGHNLQHFSRELSRYFRNLLVMRIASAGSSRLIAASEAQRQKLAETAARFSEEDLTRYLQLSLDLFRDLQFSLQPRFHLEMGLVRMVHAGRLQAIEEALAEVKAAPPSGPPPPTPKPASATQAEPPASDASARERLHAWLVQQGHTHLADAVENSTLAISGPELQIATAKTYAFYFRDRQLADAVHEVFGRPLKLQVTIREAEVAQVFSPPNPNVSTDDALTERALSNPEVQRFQEAFPGSKVYKVRNLKE